MGRAKMLPRFFGWVHPKYQTPVFSILFVGLICGLAPLFGETVLVWLLDTAAFSTVIVYLLISISFLLIRKKEPELKTALLYQKRQNGWCWRGGHRDFFPFLVYPIQFQCASVAV